MDASLQLLPYPQQVEMREGALPLGPPELEADDLPPATRRLALACLQRVLPADGPPLRVRLGSRAHGLPAPWLSESDRAFLTQEEAPAGSAVGPASRLPPPALQEAYLLTLDPAGATIVGRTPQAALHGVQTLVQLARQARRERRADLPCLRIRDWPDLRWRCLSPSLTWYSGWNRLEGYDLNNWTLEEWKALVDWSLEHKLNAWALCMYGYWPFTLPGYPETTLAVDSFFFDPAVRGKIPRRFVHRNIEREFLPQLIDYARERGIKMHAYIGKNSFNGGYLLHHPEANAGGAAELLPFAPGVAEYWDAFLARLLELGFDGFVFEDPEAYHVPNQNDDCYRTFWAPWAERYGFSSREETNANQPPLGVHVEYYTWLFRQFDAAIQRHAARLDRRPEIYLISHFLLSRILGEGGTEEQIGAWLDLIDEKQGRRVPYIINESDEARYTALLGGERVASLGGRGGSCLCAWRRMTGVNNNATPGPMGASVDWERDCQRRIQAAGGFGAMAYVFEWRSNEIYGAIGGQHLWNARGVPGIDNQDQVGFLDYAYRLHYGDPVGALVARALDASPCVNDAMVLEEVHGAQYPETGRALHRDYQLLAAQADEAVRLARAAYRRWTGREPDLERPAYRQETFRWDASPAADHLFKEEALRWLCVELRRARLLCEGALAHRRAARLAAEGAPDVALLADLDAAIARALESQRLYHLNFDDDYHWNEGLCVTLADRLQALRDGVAAGDPEARAALGPALFIPWEKITDLLPDEQPGTPPAGAPGLLLQVHLGLNTLRDESCHGVVFTVQQETDAGWETLFRRTLGRRSRQWERWDIPLRAPHTMQEGEPALVRLRLLTDAYTRRRDRGALNWEWALWGQPQVVEVMPGGGRRVLADLIEQLDEAAFQVRLDQSGLERRFDGEGGDSTGARFQALAPSALTRLRAQGAADRQWLPGFDPTAPSAGPHHSPYRSYLGTVRSWWGYAQEQGQVGWHSALVPEKRDTALVFIGGTDYVPGEAELWCNGERLLIFDTGRQADARWRAGDIELRYLHGGDTRDERTTYGLSGVFVLLLPAGRVTPGERLRLEVRMQAGGHAWFMLHGFEDALRAAERVLPPEPPLPAVCAVPPHRDGASGVTAAEFAIGR